MTDKTSLTEGDGFLIAPCGINCGVCYAHLREKNKCPGCRADDTGKPVTRVACKIKTCVILKKKRLASCFQCDQMPCKDVARLDKRYRIKHRLSVVENLVNLKGGLRNFMKLEKEKWICRECGGTVCVHTRKCNRCGMVQQ